MKEKNFSEIIDRLGDNYPVEFWTEKLTPFEVLVAVILSQATSRAGNILAFGNLRKNYKLTPRRVAKIPTARLVSLIKPAGLQQVRGPRLKEMSRFLLKEYGGDLDKILSLPKGEARKKLLEIPAVGPKTADVMLEFVGSRGTLPIDTHIDRISKRLGLVHEKAKYEAIKSKLESLVPPGQRRRVHLLLIEFGRETCRARNPLCGKCEISAYCPHRKSGK